MSTVSRGFRGRRRPTAELPPGQYLVQDFPVLSAGPTPSIDLADWELAITSETDEQRRWDWDGFRNLPSEPVTVDLHRPAGRPAGPGSPRPPWGARSQAHHGLEAAPANGPDHAPRGPRGRRTQLSWVVSLNAMPRLTADLRADRTERNRAVQAPSRTSSRPDRTASANAW